MAGYRESFGRDSYNGDYDDEWYSSWDGTDSVTQSHPLDDDEWAESWQYSVENGRNLPTQTWDDMAQKWTCTCAPYIANGVCFHVYRFRKETLISVDERFL